MRSLAVALDETPASGSALDVAVALAGRFDAALTGLTVLDIDYLTAPQPMPIGGAYYKFKSDLARLEHANEQTVRLREQFLARCAASKVRCKVAMLEGAPSEEVRTAAVTHDAIMMGRDTEFHGEPSGGLAKTVARILKEQPRPLFVIPTAAKPPSRVLIAYDGSVAAARALQIFTLLGLARDCELHAVSTHPERGVAERHLQTARAYLQLYGYDCDAHALTSSSDPAQVLIDHVSGVGADLLVMGAYGHRGWRETLLGSCTTRLLAQCPTSLFIYH